jgi:hypothetical protein
LPSARITGSQLAIPKGNQKKLDAHHHGFRHVLAGALLSANDVWPTVRKTSRRVRELEAKGVPGEKTELYLTIVAVESDGKPAAQPVPLH